MLIVAVLIGAAVAAAHMVPFPFLMEAFRPSRSLWHVKGAPGTPPTLYFTFDDGPNAQWTPPLLDALREHQVRATFFLIDEHITEATSPIVRRMAAEGHAIGLHSGTRRLMVLSPDALAEHLNRAAGRIQQITGQEPCRLFRPHAGWRSATMYEGLAKVGYRLAGWSWGMWDWDWWRSPRAERVGNRIVQKASAGDIIVIHDGHHKNPAADRRHAGETIARIAPLLRNRGFRFGTLCDAAPASSLGHITLTVVTALCSSCPPVTSLPRARCAPTSSPGQKPTAPPQRRRDVPKRRASSSTISRNKRARRSPWSNRKRSLTRRSNW